MLGQEESHLKEEMICGVGEKLPMGRFTGKAMDERLQMRLRKRVFEKMKWLIRQAGKGRQTRKHGVAHQLTGFILHPGGRILGRAENEELWAKKQEIGLFLLF